MSFYFFYKRNIFIDKKVSYCTQNTKLLCRKNNNYKRNIFLFFLFLSLSILFVELQYTV